MSDEIMVSICCLAYNHEPYIRKCLDGFIMQRTSFKYEVLIHDDASTDHTTDIIREYEAKYPDIIKPIYQTENQYSKGVKISFIYQYPRAKGKYIALCEGDDYWTDEYKLQKQYDFLEENPLYTMCVHQAIKHNVKYDTDKMMTLENSERDYSVDEVIIGGGALFSTNSLMAKTNILREIPDCFYAKDFGDYQLFVYGAISGGLHYLPDCMSVYNCGTIGSWTERIERDRQNSINNLIELINMLKKVNEYYNYKYEKPINYKIRQIEYRKYKLEGNLVIILMKKYKCFYDNDKKQGFSPVKECVVNAFPWIYSIKRYIYE